MAKESGRHFVPPVLFSSTALTISHTDRNELLPVIIKAYMESGYP